MMIGSLALATWLRMTLMLCLSLGGLAACANASQNRRSIATPIQAQAQPTTITAVTAITATLRVGEQVSLAGTTAVLHLATIIEDSRCHANAHCIWAGRVVVSGTFSTPEQQYPFILGTISGMDDAPRTVQTGVYQLSITEVEPYPEQYDQLRASDYQVQFLIEPSLP
ncbi:MAG: hypothetical protein AB4911_14285 [Oscillochloridaceae bacterium umkhey_bin13]